MASAASRSVWPKAASLLVARALAGHRTLGLVAGALVYILALTGSLLVFNQELQRWEQPRAPEMTAITPEAVDQAARSVLAREPEPTSHLWVHLPRPELPRTVITTDTQAVFVAESGAIAGGESFPWTQFVLDLHYYLHLPQVLGLTAVGALGVLMLALTVSGLVAHPRILRDAFTLRKGSDPVAVADLHNRLSVWTMPFHVAIALTGALLGLATILAVVLASVHFSGDTDQVFAPIFGSEPAHEDRAPEQVALANVVAPLEHMARAEPDVIPSYLVLHDPGTPRQHVSVIGLHPERLIFGEYYNFTADGAFIGTTGMADGSVSQQVVASVYNVHFGNWGGLPVKLVYGALGLVLCVIVASGLRLYLTKRASRPRLAAAWRFIVWGVPALLAVTLLVSIVTEFGTTTLTGLFWGGLALGAAAAGYLGRPAQIGGWARGVAGVGLLFAVVGHLSVLQPSLRPDAIAGVSLAFAVSGLALLASARASRPRLVDASTAAP